MMLHSTVNSITAPKGLGIPMLSTLIRAIFNGVSKVIQDCIGFVLLS